MTNELIIDGRRIGRHYSPYIIAELSGNHNGDLARALEHISLAKQCGAHAIKIQTYRADTMTIECDRSDFLVESGLWAGKTLYDLYDWAHTPWEWHEALFNKAKELGITLFSSPFDETAVDFLESLGTPAYKVASFEMTDLPLVEKIAKTGKPIIISTGMATFDEIEETVAIVNRAGNKQLCLLHCVSAYPADHKEANLRTIRALADKFNCVVGLSDHTLSNCTSLASVALGAAVIEKHFIDSRQSEGPDAAFSLEPTELKQLVDNTKVVWESLGEVLFGCTSGEKNSTVFRRSVYAVQDIKKGELFTTSNLRRIRPGYGIAPKYLEQLLGRQCPTDLKRGQAIRKDILANLNIVD